MTKVETEFTEALLDVLNQAEALTGIEEPRLAESARTRGGAPAVREMLRRGQTTRQFSRLAELGRLDLTPEHLVTRGKYSALFTDEEADLCLSALLEAGAYKL